MDGCGGCAVTVPIEEGNERAVSLICVRDADRSARIAAASLSWGRQLSMGSITSLIGRTRFKVVVTYSQLISIDTHV